MVTPPSVIDEELLSVGVVPKTRKDRGVYFTPAPLVQAVLELAGASLPPGPLSVIDPACGAGAFLAAARNRFPLARFFGLELDPSSAAQCRARVSQATVLVGDALRDGWPRLLEALPENAHELWVGNPPYNGTSLLLSDKDAWEKLLASLPKGLALPRGLSLRDDFAFFLLRAAGRLIERPGTLTFVTPATLLDGYLYASVREVLLGHLTLVEGVELGSGLFQGTRVKTCVTVWTSKGPGALQPQYRRRLEHSRPTRLRAPLGEGQIPAAFLESDPRPRAHPSVTGRPPFHSETDAPASLRRSAPNGLAEYSPHPEGHDTGLALAFTLPLPFTPRAPSWVLRPTSGEAEALDSRWREAGEPLTSLVPVHFPGLKTRFDELLVDSSRERLFERVSRFLSCRREELSIFVADHGIPDRLLPKLELLWDFSRGATPSTANVRPFLLYAGDRHRQAIPREAWAWCYLDRKLIPRGDHRLQGSYDPHRGAEKLIFNTRELPLSAAFLEEEACVHAYRHTRFAPLRVPKQILDRGPQGARGSGALEANAPLGLLPLWQRLQTEGPSAQDLDPPLDPLVPNLSPRALAFAGEHGGVRRFFQALARFINGARVQRIWAPALGAAHDLPVPLTSELFLLCD
jgi:hypothetical protein